MAREGTAGPAEPRRSPGGYVVEASLRAVSYSDAGGAIALVETARPRLRRFEAVVCQNAWNFVDGGLFRSLVAEYPRHKRAVYRLRRLTARWNTWRAPHVVVLSQYMQDILRARGTEAVVFPVVGPHDLFADVPQRPPTRTPPTPFWLVPGTLSWYKDPFFAVRLALQVSETDGRAPFLYFAGGDDGSGCAAELARTLQRHCLDAEVGEVDRQEMMWLLKNAEVTVIPSRLESLSLSFAEALIHSQEVWARPLPVHREAAAALGGSPRWVGEDASQHVHAPPARSAERDASRVAHVGRTWAALADFLNEAVADIDGAATQSPG